MMMKSHEMLGATNFRTMLFFKFTYPRFVEVGESASVIVIPPPPRVFLFPLVCQRIEYTNCRWQGKGSIRESRMVWYGMVQY